MKPAPFDLVMAESIDEALETLAEYGTEAQVIAGGQSLVAMLNMRLASPKVLVDINRIADLNQIHAGKARSVRVGAAFRQRDLERAEPDKNVHPLVREALPLIGHVQTRNRGTVCGSLCHADPSSELPLCLAALDGSVELQSTGGKRVVRAGDFFNGLLSTAIEPGEMMVSAEFPAALPDTGYAFTEVAERHGDFALAAFAAIVANGSIRLAVGGVADRPIAVSWSDMNMDDLPDALNDFAWQLEARDDNHATAHYRRDLVRKRGLATIQVAQQRRQAR